MYPTVQNCTNCGANLTINDLRLQGCPYCQTVYPHRSMAEQQMQINQQMMGRIVQQQYPVVQQATRQLRWLLLMPILTSLLIAIIVIVTLLL